MTKYFAVLTALILFLSSLTPVILAEAAVRESGIPRDEIWITSKLWPAGEDLNRL